MNEKHYVYIWADGIHFNIRLDDERTCLLVIIGAAKDGKKELLAVQNRYRESKLSWQEILQDLKVRNLRWPPALAIGDGGLGLKEKIFDIYMADTRKNALKAYGDFISHYQAKYPKACDCLIKDKDELFTFYDFPAKHWTHLRTTNPIESTFATVRLRTKRTKGYGSRKTTLMMVYKLAEPAERRWGKLNKHEYISLVAQGNQFIDGVLTDAADVAEDRFSTAC